MSTEIVVFKQFKADLEAFKEHNAELSFDFAIPEEEEACRAHHRKLRKLYNGTNDLKLSTTKTMREDIAVINAEAEAIKTEVDAIAKPFKSQMDAKDAEVQKEIDDLAEKNRLIAEYEADETLAWLEYREQKAQAIIDAAEEVERKAKEAAEQVKRDEEAAAKQAKAVETALAQVKKDAVEAAEKAKKEKAEAILEVQRKAHEAKGKLVAKHLKEKNDAQAVIDEFDKVKAARVADVKNRKEIEQAIITVMTLVIDESLNLPPADIAQEILDAIVEGEISHIQIVY